MRDIAAAIRGRYFRSVIACPEGGIFHDGDCHVFGRKVCTCGLLHMLLRADDREALYPKYYEEYGKQNEVLDARPSGAEGQLADSHAILDALAIDKTSRDGAPFSLQHRIGILNDASNQELSDLQIKLSQKMNLLVGVTEDRNRKHIALLLEERGHDVTRSDLTKCSRERDDYLDTIEACYKALGLQPENTNPNEKVSVTLKRSVESHRVTIAAYRLALEAIHIIGASSNAVSSIQGVVEIAEKALSYKAEP